MTYLGLVAGPVCASTFLPRFGWRSIFLVEVPAGIVCIMLALCALRPDLRTGRQQAPIPLLGTFLWIGCLSPFLLAPGEGAHWRWRSITVVSLFVTSAFVALLFVEREPFQQCAYRNASAPAHRSTPFDLQRGLVLRSSVCGRFSHPNPGYAAGPGPLGH
jgi:hypothetical protein